MYGVTHAKVLAGDSGDGEVAGFVLVERERPRRAYYYLPCADGGTGAWEGVRARRFSGELPGATLDDPAA